MPAPKDWTFVQLGPPNKTMTLSGYSAPFGRQRQKPVVRDAVTIRESTTYYAGSNGPPTRHVFGTKFEQWELTGRFMDPTAQPNQGSTASAGYAKTQTDYVKQFVVDAQPVEIRWGDIVGVRGFIKSFDPGRESEFQVEWKMTILVDEDIRKPQATPILPVLSPSQYLPNLAQVVPIPPASLFKPSFLDGIDSLISTFNGAVGQLVNIANQISSFETALAGDLKRLRAGIGQVKTAILTLQGAIVSAQNDALLIRHSADGDILGLSYVSTTNVAVTKALGSLADMDRAAEAAERGKALTTYVAQTGDTWESIAAKIAGSLDKVDQIRSLNNVKYGSLPEPGRAYKVPFKV